MRDQIEEVREAIEVAFGGIESRCQCWTLCIVWVIFATIVIALGVSDA